jgi:hypothetical protein
VTAAALHDPPPPAPSASWPRAGRTTFVRCLWLAALLHGLALWSLGRLPLGPPPAPPEPARLELTLRSASDPRGAPPPATAPPRAAAPARMRPAAPEPRPQMQPPSPLAASPAVAPGTAMALPDAPPAGADADARTGAVVALPAHAASAPRPLNLELGRWRSAEAGPPSIARRAAESESRPVPEPLAAAIEQAARADCARAHSGAGLLAVVPLMLDALRGSGCKW